MWLFGAGRKQDSKTSQPVQRQICIRTRDGIDEQGEPVTLLGTTTTVAGNTSNGYVTTTTTTTSRLASSFRQTLNNSFSGFLFRDRGGTSSAGGRRTSSSVVDDESELDGNGIRNLNGDDDNQEEEDNSDSDSTSSSLSGTKYNGNRGGNNGRIANRSYLSYNREPLDVRTWSNVTSPGFTSRVVQQANGNGMEDVASRNLRTFTGGPTINRASMSRSPNLSLRLGQLPISTSPRRKTSAMINFPSPNRSSFSYNRFSRVHKRDMNGAGTIFVKLAPVDLKSLPVVPIQNSGIYPNNNSYDRGDQQQQHSSHGPSRSPNSGGMGIRAGGSGGGSSPTSSYPTSPGLGGSPLAQRFSRLGWPDKYPGRSIGPGPPGYMPMSPTNSNILDMMHNRKRGRDLDGSVNSSQMTDPINNRAAGPSSSTPKSITSPEDQKKFTKRVKYVSEQDIRHHSNRPLNYDAYHDSSPSGSDPMTSKSILEQMNQTEKRFFPDVSPITSAAKRTKLSSNTPLSGIRKRKVMGENGISIVELEDDEVAQDPKSKTGKFCHCNECYAEAAGISTQNNKSMVASPPRPLPQPPKKTVTFEASTSSKMNTSSALPTCDKGTGTEMEMTTPEIIIRMATQHTLITKEKYDYDRIKRIERFKRILGLEPIKPAAENDQKPGDQQPVDVMDGKANKIAPLPTIELIPPTPATSTFSLSQPRVTEVTTTSTPTTNNNDLAPASTSVSEAPKVTFGAVNLIPASNSVGGTATDSSDVKPVQFIQPKVETATTELPIKNEGTGGFSFGSPAAITTAQQSTMPTFSAPASTISFGGFSSTPTTTSAPAATNNTSFGGFSSAAPTTTAPPAYGSTTSVFGSGTGFGAAAPTTTTNASSGFGSVSTNAAPVLTFGNNNQIQTTSAAAITTTSGFNFGQSTTTTTTTSASSSSLFSLGGGQNGTTNNTAPSNIFGSLTPSSTNTTTNTNNVSGFGSSTTSSSVPTFGLSASNPISFGGVNSTTTTPTFGSSAATTGFGAVAPQTATPFQFGQAQAQPASNGFNFGSGATAGTQQPPSFQFGGAPQTGTDQQSVDAAGNKIVQLPKLELIVPTPTTSTSTFSFSQPQVTSTLASTTNNNDGAPLSINGTSKVTFGATNSFPTFGSVSGTTADSSDAKPFLFQAKPEAATTELPIKNGIMGGFNFGSQATTTTAQQFPTPSIFGSAATATNNNTSFGGFSSVAPTTSASPAFGSTTPMFGSGGGSIFGSTAPIASINPTSSVFGSSNTSTGAFGASTNAPTPLFAFGNNNQIQTTSAPTTGGFNFGQSTTTTTSSAPSGSLFSLGGQNNNNAPSNIFGSLTPSSTNTTTNNNNISAFGSSTSSAPAFGISASSPISQPFGGGNLATPTPAFGSSAATNSTFGFGAAQAPQAAAPFQFGQAQSQPQAAAPNGGFNFGSVATAGGTQQPPVFQFGGAPQTAGAGLAGGFNFASQAASTTPMGAPSPGGNMFSLGQATAQPRRRPVQRRYR